MMSHIMANKYINSGRVKGRGDTMVGRRGTQGYGYGTQMKSNREVTAVPAVLSSYPPV